MSEITPKPISDELASLIKKAVESFTDFIDIWGKAIIKAKGEGIGEEELREIARPLLRQKLSTNQIRYLFHRDEEIKRSQENRDKQKDAAYVRRNDSKKELEKGDTAPPKQEPEPTSEEKNVENKLESVGVDLKQERIEELEKKLATVTQEKEQLAQVVGKDSFKKASDPENMDIEYFPKISLMELMGKIRSKQASGWHFVENRMRYIS